MPTPADILSSSTKLEITERAAKAQLMRVLNDALGDQEAAWAALDKQDANDANVVYQPLELERLRPDAFHRGARPSLLRMPADHFPAVTVMADTVRADQESMLHDSRNVYRDSLWLEIVVRSDKYSMDEPDEWMKAEDAVDRRAKRSGEAAIQAILSEPTLGRVVEPISSTPSLTVGEPFALDKDGGIASQPDNAGKMFIFSAARVDFTLKVYSALPEVVEPVPDPLLAGIGS
jgi:hypothetical protein